MCDRVWCFGKVWWSKEASVTGCGVGFACLSWHLSSL